MTNAQLIINRTKFMKLKMAGCYKMIFSAELKRFKAQYLGSIIEWY